MPIFRVNKTLFKEKKVARTKQSPENIFVFKKGMQVCFTSPKNLKGNEVKEKQREFIKKYGILSRFRKQND